jgi:hypothetical protein
MALLMTFLLCPVEVQQDVQVQVLYILQSCTGTGVAPTATGSTTPVASNHLSNCSSNRSSSRLSNHDTNVDADTNVDIQKEEDGDTGVTAAKCGTKQDNVEEQVKEQVNETGVPAVDCRPNKMTSVSRTSSKCLLHPVDGKVQHV